MVVVIADVHAFRLAIDDAASLERATGQGALWPRIDFGNVFRRVAESAIDENFTVVVSAAVQAERESRDHKQAKEK